jgi:hypothetical protein
MAFYQKRVMMSSLKNLPELWKKAKAEGRLAAAKDKGIKYLNLDKLPGLKDLDLSAPDYENADKAKEAMEKGREKIAGIRDNISKAMNDKDSVAWVDASTLNDADVAELITAAKSGKLPAIAAFVIKTFEEGTKTLQKQSDAETKKYDAAYRNKDQEAAKEITTNLSTIRSLLVEHATCANFFASVVFRALSSEANAIKSIAGISGKDENKKG